MKKLFKDFRDFINRGNVIDLAVGVMIGAAFKAIVDSLVNDIISPVIGLLGTANLAELTWTAGTVTIGWGAFVSAIINFLIMALVLLFIVKAINRATHLKKKEEAPAAAPTTKKCPFCCSDIPLEATRCPHCTSEIK